MFWKSKPRTAGPEHERAIARSSDEWQAEIARLKAEADQLEVERAATVAEAIVSAITAAENRQHPQLGQGWQFQHRSGVELI